LILLYLYYRNIQKIIQDAAGNHYNTNIGFLAILRIMLSFEDRIPGEVNRTNSMYN